MLGRENISSSGDPTGLFNPWAVFLPPHLRFLYTLALSHTYMHVAPWADHCGPNEGPTEFKSAVPNNSHYIQQLTPLNIVWYLKCEYLN